MSRRAVILAGGKGSRLRPYTVVLPKPLMPIGEYPILEVIIRQLAAQKFTHITIAVGHQANLIRAFFEDGKRWGVQIDYSLEKTPLSTMAPLHLISNLPDHFILMNGDVLTDLPIGKLYDDHVASKRLFTIAAAERNQVIDYGVLKIDSKKRMTQFNEKPASQYLVSMGIYAVNKSVLKYVPRDKKFGFDDLMHTLLKQKQSVHVEPYAGYWADIGRLDDYMQAIDDFEKHKKRLLPHG